MIRTERFASLPNPEKIKLTGTERLTIASSSFGTPYNNDDLIALLPESQRDLANEIVKGTGMTRRFFRYVESRSTPEQIVDDAVNAICTLVTIAIKERGWSQLDHLIVTSVFLPTEIGQLALDRLNQKDTTHQAYRLACAGAVTGFVDSLLDSHLTNQNVAIVSAEPLSALFDERHFTPEHLHVPAIFGDKYTVFCYNTADFMIPKDQDGPVAKTVFIPDHGVIKLSPWYQFRQDNSKRKFVDHYEFADGASEITSISDQEIIMALFAPEGGMRVSMNGLATAKHFIRHTPPIIRSIVERGAAAGYLPTQAVYHQPSEPVNLGIDRAVNRNLGLTLPSMEFTLGKIGESNSSSATTVVAWQSQIENGQFNEKLPFLVCAPGIGSAITAAIICPNEN